MTSANRRLNSWKEIAEYLGKDVRTVIRWEKARGLPVHRIPGPGRPGVFAWSTEVDEWVRGRPTGPEEQGPLETARFQQTAHFRSTKISLLAFASVILAVAVTRCTSRPSPQLSNPVQITNDGRPKGSFAADGSKLYFFAREDERWALVQVALDTGDESIRPTTLASPNIFAVSPEGPNLMAGDSQAGGYGWPVWLVPTGGGRSLRLGNVCASTAAWSPDARRLAYAAGRDLYVANADSSGSRKIATLSHDIGTRIRWSPNGQLLRFSLIDELHRTHRLWEISADGSRAHVLLPDWSRTAADQEFGGDWVPGKDAYVFVAVHNGSKDVWAIRERSLLNWPTRQPVRLTTNLNQTLEVVPSKDGKRLYIAASGPDRAELVRYDRKIGRFVTYPSLPGMSIGHTSFSPDREWVAYIAFPELTLWKMRIDGTGRTQLTFKPQQALLPQWSPDGSQIAFMGSQKAGNEPTRVYLISAEGGPARPAFESPYWQGAPNWTADGKSLIFGENGEFNPIRESCSIHEFDLKRGTISDLPGTQGLWTPRPAPTRPYVAALTRDNRLLVLYDVRTARRTELYGFPDSKIGDNPVWSHDGRYLYLDSPYSSDPAIYRIEIATRRIERVASLKGVPRINRQMGLWIGLTPDDSPLVLRDLESTEIFALEWNTS